MMRKILMLAGAIWLVGAMAAGAQQSVEKILPLDGHITQDGRKIELNWFSAKPPRVGSVTVKRRLYGQTGGQSWKTLAAGLGPVMRYTDATISPGVAYEYQVLRSARDIVDVGYWLAGTELAAREQRGNAYVIVDETIAEAIAPRLARFERDLIGDGWRVQRHKVPRGDVRRPLASLEASIPIKTWLQERYREDPFGQHAVILVGHVPIVRSGKVNPDGHERVPHATDLFYADMDGRWSALRTGFLLDNRVPGDFIEMQIGRIDFAMVSAGKRETEVRLLRSYFDKNHHWRNGMHGDLREAYSTAPHFDVERRSLRNIVGQNNIAQGGHHDTGEEKPWLWGVDFGDFNGYEYAAKYANKAVFAINFGSGKQKIEAYFSPMTALLAQPWYPVAVGWGGRPAWWLHHMALGGTIGDVHMRTVNNGEAAKPYRESMDYYPTGFYLMRNAIWVNLLGDPTLRAFPMAPPRQVTATVAADGVRLEWQASPDADVRGYRIFRAGAADQDFVSLTGSTPVAGTTFIDTAPPQGGAVYMVRAYGLKQVYAGSFYTLSQGAFAVPDAAAEEAQDMALETATGQPVRLPPAFNRPVDGRISAFVEGPDIGRLVHDGEGWVYTPPAGFTGSVSLPFTVSDQWHTWERQLTLRVGE